MKNIFKYIVKVLLFPVKKIFEILFNYIKHPFSLALLILVLYILGFCDLLKGQFGILEKGASKIFNYLEYQYFEKIHQINLISLSEDEQDIANITWHSAMSEGYENPCLTKGQDYTENGQDVLCISNN